ncbi:MAG: site-2 protease family protein [Dehalococcoidia bacterium]|nr:MAG: site-2 protease family protein [Dehalococcoidia bacterium]
MASAFNIGKLFGIQFRLHYTWFIIFALVTVSLSWQYFPSAYPGWNQFFYWVLGIATSLLLFASVVAHELAHSLVSRLNGIPVKSITLFIFGGMAQIAREVTRPGMELRMAAAGPICSLAIAGFFYLVYLLTQSIIEPVAVMAYYLFYINMALAIFNLIPGFPLDGGRVFRSLLWHFTGSYKRSTQIAVWLGRGIGYLFIFVGILAIFIHPFGLNWFSGLWLAFIGWFLESAASASYRQVKWRDALRGFSASQVMTTNSPLISPDITVSQLVQSYILTGGGHSFMVVSEGRVEGVLTLENIKSVPQRRWSVTKVREIMTPLERLAVAHPDQDALDILEQMDEKEINQIAVVDGGRVIGLIDRNNLIRFLRVRSELGV